MWTILKSSEPSPCNLGPFPDRRKSEILHSRQYRRWMASGGHILGFESVGENISILRLQGSIGVGTQRKFLLSRSRTSREGCFTAPVLT